MNPDELVEAMARRNGELAKRPKPAILPPDSRPLGLILFLVGLGGVLLCLLNVQSALDHAPSIWHSRIAPALSPPILLIGLRWLVLGRKAPEALDTSYPVSLPGKIYYIASLLTGPICGYAYIHTLDSLGYVSGPLFH